MNTQAFYKCSLAQSMDHLSAHKRDELQTEVKDPIGRFWNNATFTFLFNKFEKKVLRIWREGDENT